MEFAGRLFRGAGFEMLFPHDWEHLVVEDIPSFFDPEEGGVLQVASVKASSNHVDLKEELARYLIRQNVEFKEESVISYKMVHGGEGMACEFVRENRFWMVHVMAFQGRMLVVVYNSDQMPDQDSVKTLLEIIGSIKIQGEDQ